MTPIFSILIPTIPSRIQSHLIPLYGKLCKQAAGYPVEVLSLLDNKQRSVGLKRDALVQSAIGKYLAFVDDDDDIADTYVSDICDEINKCNSSDVIVFNQRVTINNDNPFTVRFGTEFENEEAHRPNHGNSGPWQDIARKPFHICVWRTAVAQQHRFPDASYSEDWHWCERVLHDVNAQSRIDKVLHYYKYSDEITEAEHIYPQ